MARKSEKFSAMRSMQSIMRFSEVRTELRILCSNTHRTGIQITQKIIRQSNVTERSLVTTCRLLNSSRSDDNPNGFTIEGFTIIENKDLQTIKR